METYELWEAVETIGMVASITEIIYKAVNEIDE